MPTATLGRAVYGTDRIAYYGMKLGENTARTDEGYLICCNVPIGRTGFQQYKGAELPEEEMDALDLKVAPTDVVELYRSAEEVFSNATLHSFEGKPFTDGHPADLLDLDSIREHQKGHVQNIRKGTEPLESGDWPMLADIVITDKDTIDAVLNGERREVSCGYLFHIGRDGKRLLQVGIRGNHVALVPKGRAGAEARINDHALDTTAQPAPQEEKKVKNTFKHILGLGLKALAASDAAPEELADAHEEVQKSLSSRAAAGADGETTARKTTGKDGEAVDRKKYHDALDRMLNEQESKTNSEDEEYEGLKKSMADWLKDCEMDAASDGADAADGEEHEEETPAREKEETEPAADAEEEEEEAATDVDPRSDVVTPFTEAEKAKSPSPGTDKAKGSDAAFVLNSLKPFIARSKDSKLKRAFDEIARGVNRKAVSTGDKGKGGYSAFTRAAGKSGKDAADSIESAAQRIKRETDAAYAAHHRRNASEVK